MGRLTNLNPSKALTEADMPPGMATDVEVTTAINAHTGATDPHTQYLLQSEGDARYRQSSVPLTDSDIPSTIARDTEVTAALNAHTSATDPHTQYLLQSEGDARYRQSDTSTAIYTAAALPTANVAGNSMALGWNSVQSGNGTGEFCNYAGLGGGDAFNFFRMGGNAVAVPTLSNRVARIDITGAYVQTSDKRVKANFKGSPGLATILKLKPVCYDHFEVVEEGELGPCCLPKVGLIAQEIRQVLPQAVPGGGDEAQELLGIDYSVVVSVLVRAIQELNEKVDLLTKKLETKN